MIRDLVLVRAGDQSLHPEWLTVDARKFNMAISYFGDEPERFSADSNYFTRFKGGKWNGIAHFFDVYPTLLDDYDYVWLPDDDISATPRVIEKIFQMARLYKLDVCQPALSCHSYYSYVETLAIPGVELRYCNMVEIMAPCLSTSVLRQFLPLMANSISGFGFDMVWGRLQPASARRCAILDSVEVTHTRPVGSVLRPAMALIGRDPWREQKLVLDKFSCAPITPMVYAARLSNQGEISGTVRLGIMMALSYWWRRRLFIQPLRMKYLRRLIVRQFINPHPSLRRVSIKVSTVGSDK